MNSKSKPVFILSGISGTGKSCILEDSRRMGVKGLRSFNKFLLNVRFGYGQPSHRFLIMDMFMQAYHIQDFTRDEISNQTWMLERSVLDGYYFTIKKFGYQQSEQDIEDMNHMLGLYFQYLTNSGEKPLVIVDIWNLDRDWIARNLKEEDTRANCWDKVDEYLKDQQEYKIWYFNKLKDLGLDYEVIRLNIEDVERDFHPDYRRLWIYRNILNR